MPSRIESHSLTRRSSAFSHNETGISGEYFVMHVLSRLGYICSMSMGSAKGIDIMVHDPDTNKFCKVEVKTARDAARGMKTRPYYSWPVGAKAEQRKEANLVYCFVHLGQSLKETRCFLFLSEYVAHLISTEHAEWAAAGKDEGTRAKQKATSLRQFWFYEDEAAAAHEDAWHLLKSAMGG